MPDHLAGPQRLLGRLVHRIAQQGHLLASIRSRMRREPLR
jgi:hypothetical protein